MTPLDLIRVATNIAQGAPRAADTCLTLLAATYAPGSAVVAVTRQGGALARALAEHIATEDLFLHHANGAEERVGAVDHDCRIRYSPWPATRGGGAARVRRLDTLHGGRRRPCLLVLAGPAADGMVSGAEGLLESAFAPPILFDLSEIASSARAGALTETWAMLADWTWYDGKLLPVDGPDDGRRLLEAFVETVFIASPPGLDRLSRIIDMRSFALAGWRPTVSADRRNWIELRPDTSLAFHGWHRMETDGEHIWRWTGPEAGATVLLPMPVSGRWRVLIDVFDWGALDGPDDVMVALGGGRLRRASWDGHRLVAGVANAPALHTDGLLRMDIVCARMRPGIYEDTRQLGLCVSGFVLAEEK